MAYGAELFVLVAEGERRVRTAEIGWLRGLLGESSQRGHWAAVRGEWGRPWGFWEDIICRAAGLLA